MPVLLDQFERPIPRTKQAVQPNAVRRVSAKYDAAQIVDENSNYWANVDSLSATAANSSSVRKKLRDRSRYEVANNSYLLGIVRTRANDVVGTGPKLQMQTDSKDINQRVEMLFMEWARQSRMASKLKTLWQSMFVDGESVGLLTGNLALKNPVKLDLKLYEADQVALPWTMTTDPLGTDGILLDDFGNPLSYTFLKHHPGDAFFTSISQDFDTIRAEFVIHLFRCERPGQYRGVPEMTPSLPLAGQLRRYTLAVIAAAETAADLAALLQTQAAPEDPDDIEPLDLFDLERRTLMTLPRGWTAMQMKAEQPATTYQMFKREIINEIGRCANMPYNVAAADSSGYNYASGRLDHQTYFKTIENDQTLLECEALDSRLFPKWWEEARMIPGYLPEEIRSEMTPPKHGWFWDGHEHVDPTKEATAQQTRLTNRTTTLAREYAREGLDWEEELRQSAREKALMEELGLTAAPMQQQGDMEDEDDE